MSLYNKLNGGSEQSKNVMTPKQFLNKDPMVQGFSNPVTFIQYAKSLRPQEIDQLEQAFEFFKAGARVVGALPNRTDKAKRNYKHPSFLMGNGQPGCKIITEGGMKEFLDAYINGSVTIGFSLDELIEEALND